MTIARRLLPLSTLLPLMLAACDGGDDSDGQPDPGAADMNVGGQQGGAGGEIGGAGGEMTPDAEVPLGCASNADCAEDAAGPICDVESGECQPAPAGALIGWGDGSPESVELTEIYTPRAPNEAPDLAFHPERDELWVLNRRPEAFGTCTDRNTFSERCQSMPGYTTIITHPGLEDQRWEIREDGNAWHFMRHPPALAMGEGDTFATCAEAATGNFENDSAMFVGPTLWSSDLDIYAEDPGPGLNGSHLDMLHASPYCMGIAHEQENIYWVFNGHVGSVDRYDFKSDHGPGYDDHSDGEIHRYVEGELSRVSRVPSHMVYNPDDGFLYIADTGNGRVVKLDTMSGEPGGAFSPVYEPLADYGYMDNAMLMEVVPAGTVEHPSGIALHDGVIYVSDNATNTFYAFDLDGTLLRTLETNLQAQSLAGIEIGRDNKLWFTDMYSGTVYRLDPK